MKFPQSEDEHSIQYFSEFIEKRNQSDNGVEQCFLQGKA